MQPMYGGMRIVGGTSKVVHLGQVSEESDLLRSALTRIEEFESRVGWRRHNEERHDEERHDEKHYEVYDDPPPRSRMWRFDTLLPLVGQDRPLRLRPRSHHQASSGSTRARIIG